MTDGNDTNAPDETHVDPAPERAPESPARAAGDEPETDSATVTKPGGAADAKGADSGGKRLSPKAIMASLQTGTGDGRVVKEAVSALAENQDAIQDKLAEQERRVAGQTRNFIILILVVSGLLFIYHLAGGHAAQTMDSMRSPEYARWLITLLFSVGTMLIMLLIVVSVLLQTDLDAKERFAQSKEILTVLIGIFGTIIGFYFGSQKTEKPDGAGTPPPANASADPQGKPPTNPPANPSAASGKAATTPAGGPGGGEATKGQEVAKNATSKEAGSSASSDGGDGLATTKKVETKSETTKGTVVPKP